MSEEDVGALSNRALNFFFMPQDLSKLTGAPVNGDGASVPILQAPRSPSKTAMVSPA